MKKGLICLLGFMFITMVFMGCKPAAKEPPLIARKVLFGNPDKASVQISHDGRYLSFLAPVNGVLNVWVGPADAPEKAQPVTADNNRGIRIYFWAYTNKHIIYAQDLAGDENWQIHVVDITTKEDRNVTPFEEIPGPDGKPITLPNGKPLRPMAQIQAVSHKFPEEILVSLNNRNPQFHDIYRLNILSGDLKLVQQNDSFMSFQTDDDYNLRFAARMTPDGGLALFQPDGKGGWQPFDTIPMEDIMTTSPIGFDRDGQVLYMIDSRGRNTAALISVNLKTGEKKLIFEDPRADVSNIMMHPVEKKVEAVAVEYLRIEWTVLDEKIKSDHEYLKTVWNGDIYVTDRTLDDKFWVVSYVVDDGPVRYYLYDRENRQARFLFTNRKELENARLSKMHPVVIKSRDGLNLVSYLTLPGWRDPDNDGRPDKPLPMVLYVHGGPWGRDSWGLNPTHQWLANRGYAVLSVNFRGSTGFGKDFINAGNLEWGRKMHDDLIDAVNWAIENKIAEKDRVAISGGSYGGYATLVGLTFTPDVFACGVDVVGPSNLITLLESIPPYWKPQLDMFASRVGDPRTEDGRRLLLERSPLTYVDRIKKPLLIGQGANDPRVKQSESDQMVKAMQEKNIPVTYVLFPDEGHGFARPENRLAFGAISELFLARHLGGRAEEIGDEFKGSTIQVPQGADQVPGLKEALALLEKR
ncbi:MAG: Dipeptidyl anminopeptidase [Candidatus Saccharicenans subterraneus]|uniref:Dipeptidyl anminopeptidase n=1 Tax=Candidatus Saccharicenans subterraneus TaxID=2508984 RepID=A0A3E2BJY0_9BACT|nr:MAG: Dipeptidyl anminopeptidase [Candidatus Saccharicenans subterraneum]